MLIDQDYLNSIIQFFLKNTGKTFGLQLLTKEPERFIAHVKVYIDARIGSDYPEVEFNNDYTKLKIYAKTISNTSAKK